MIDTDKLRKLAQAATPHVGHACKYQEHHWLREGHVDFENADLFIASERPTEDAAFYAAANPAAVLELLDRIETAEKERIIDEERIADLMADLNRVGQENEELRARLEAAEKNLSCCHAEREEAASLFCPSKPNCLLSATLSVTRSHVSKR